MAWSEVPVSANDFITNAPFDEVMEKIRILWDVFPAYYSGYAIEPEPLPADGPHGANWWYYRRVSNQSRIDVAGIRYYGSVIGWFRRIIKDMHYLAGVQSGRWYESGGIPVQRYLSWLMTACGVGSWTQITWDTSDPYKYARGAKLKTAGDCLLELKTVLDYIKDYAIVHVRTSFTNGTYAHCKTAQKIWDPDEASWLGARVHATVDVNGIWNAGYNAIYSSFGNWLGMPFISVQLKNREGEWNLPDYGKQNLFLEEHTNPTVVACRGAMFRRCSSAGWHADLKREDCEYWLKFLGGDPDWVSSFLGSVTNKHVGMMALPYELNGVDIEGGCPANDGAWDSSGRFVAFDYADWDWVNDRGDIYFDDSSWGSFPIPPHCDAPATWSIGSVSYYVGNFVEHSMPAGETWVCIQDHVSAAGNEPGTPGGDSYWVEALQCCWDGGDDGYTTGFVWSQPPPYRVYVKPVYADY